MKRIEHSVNEEAVRGQFSTFDRMRAMREIRRDLAVYGRAAVIIDNSYVDGVPMPARYEFPLQVTGDEPNLRYDFVDGVQL